MNAAVRKTAHDVIEGFFGAPTDEPLVIERVGDEGVVFSRGIPATRMTITAAASFLGMSRSTLYKNFIDKKKLRPGTDGKLARKTVLKLFNDLDGRD